MHIIRTAGAVFLCALLVLLAGRAASRSFAPAAGATPALSQIRLEQIVSGLDSPVYLTHARDGSERLFIVEQEGTIRIVRDGRLLARPFLDIRRRVIDGGELGLLSVAFHPQYARNGRFFVNYTADSGSLRTVIA